MSPAKIETVSCVLLTKAVDRDTPFTFTVAPLTKFRPCTVSEKAGPPATTLGGLRDEIVGGGSEALKAMLVELPPPGAGLITETKKAPAVATSAAKTADDSCVELTNVAGLDVAPNNMLAPLTKFVPFTVRVKLPLPACTDMGEIDEIVGRELTVPEEIGVKI